MMFIHNIFPKFAKQAEMIMNKRFTGFILIFFLFLIKGFPQFAPPAGQPGSTAIYKDSSCFVAWATSCKIIRGYQNIADTALGFASTGDSSMALGPAGQNGIVSLGDGGSAVISFERPLYNGPGWDFAVFENSFADYFLELAFVDVSSDGVHYIRFPSVSLTDTTIQLGNFDSSDARNLNNLAGKYRVFYGTPFDLEELKNEAGLDVSHITHIKITDVTGSLDNRYASRDSYGNKINDPWPTPFASSGFDVDAVGAIHQIPAGINELPGDSFLHIYPNPVYDILHLQFEAVPGPGIHCQLFSTEGALLRSSGMNKNLSADHNLIFDLSDLAPGTYFIRCISGEHIITKKIILIK